MSEKKEEGKTGKPGLMKRLFSARKLSVNADLVAEEEKNKTEKKNRMQRMHSVDAGALKKRTDDDLIDRKKAGVKKQQSDGGKSSSKGSSQSGGRKKSKGRKRKRSRQKGDVNIDVDVSKPLQWPVTPEIILAYHKKQSFLNPNEEWLVVELNEYECLVENMDIIKIIAKHSKFFEVEPDELWDEFFEFMEEVPTYDEIVNYDVWQEFRDEKYPY